MQKVHEVLGRLDMMMFALVLICICIVGAIASAIAGAWPMVIMCLLMALLIAACIIGAFSRWWEGMKKSGKSGKIGTIG